jgi:hypothetical protein
MAKQLIIAPSRYNDTNCSAADLHRRFNWKQLTAPASLASTAEDSD